MKNKIAIFDIDMTIIDSAWVWQHLDECKSFSAVYDTYGDNDKPIQTTINLIKQLHENSIQPIFLTARPLSDFDKTISRNVKIALNTLQQAIGMIEKTGTSLQQETEDLEDEYVITIRIHK